MDVIRRLMSEYVRFPQVMLPRCEQMKRVADTVYLALTSPLVLIFGSILGLGCFLPVQVVVSILGWVVGAMILFPEKIPRRLFYEGVVIDNLVRSVLTRCKLMRSPYYSLMGDKIYIGGIPLQDFDHHLIIQQLDVKAILMVVEDYELQQRTVLSEAVQIETWIRARLQVLQIHVVDLQSVSTADLHKAEDCINEHKDHGVYNHCKVGRGRSLMADIAYLVKHQGMNGEEAFKYAKSQRPSVKLKPEQHQRLIDCEKG
jgi:protein-tyrosine phosphatase